ncbi:(d)CMP kinase [Persicobacter psychrovividus]|uniref:Cytidylate kinase n=1 Tax=Persicobacter psychrovividus TaxID=387638 RepID=A0ABM7VBV9_9BACT|nr:cytidylate kinase [Persicobacter psychrovividus]
MSNKIVIAIDGYSGCGKSSTAKAVAAALGYGYIDTGAMYRSVTLYFKEHNIKLTDPKAVKAALKEINISFVYNDKSGLNETFLNSKNVEKEIRKMYISEGVSEVAVIAEVRKAMVDQQRKMGKKKGVVMDGRDIASVVFPNAELKVFMTADVRIRAERRQKELFDQKQLVNLEDIIDNLKKRDRIDTSRAESPLTQVEDAMEVDTSFMNFDEQVNVIVEAAQKLIGK